MDATGNCRSGRFDSSQTANCRTGCFDSAQTANCRSGCFDSAITAEGPKPPSPIIFASEKSGIRILHGKSKLCHRKLSEFVSVLPNRTRFPESKSCATGLSSTLDRLDDQTMLCVPLRRTSDLLPLIVKTPCKPVIGLFRLATHTTVSGVALYHIPKYRNLELPGEKKPSSNLWLVETKVSPSRRDWFEAKVSPAMENFKKVEESSEAKEEKKKMKKAWLSIAFSRQKKRLLKNVRHVGH
ncbi:unnamed protein product [Camellia sinensis]